MRGIGQGGLGPEESWGRPPITNPSGRAHLGQCRRRHPRPYSRYGLRMPAWPL